MVEDMAGQQSGATDRRQEEKHHQQDWIVDESQSRSEAIEQFRPVEIPSPLLFFGRDEILVEKVVNLPSAHSECLSGCFGALEQIIFNVHKVPLRIYSCPKGSFVA